MLLLKYYININPAMKEKIITISKTNDTILVVFLLTGITSLLIIIKKEKKVYYIGIFVLYFNMLY